MRNVPAYPVSSADNVLRLLRLLREQGELRVADAANRLGVAPSTAHRLLATLRHHEFAVQDRRHVYLPGPALSAIQATMPRPDVRAVIHRCLRELVQQCEETAHFMTLEGNGARFIDGVEGSRSLRCGTRIGLLMPAHMTSGGKALLAELTGDPKWEALCPPLVPLDRDARRAWLASVARAGIVKERDAA